MLCQTFFCRANKERSGYVFATKHLGNPNEPLKIECSVQNLLCDTPCADNALMPIRSSVTGGWSARCPPQLIYCSWILLWVFFLFLCFSLAVPLFPWNMPVYCKISGIPLIFFIFTTCSNYLCIPDQWIDWCYHF